MTFSCMGTCLGLFLDERKQPLWRESPSLLPLFIPCLSHSLIDKNNKFSCPQSAVVSYLPWVQQRITFIQFCDMQCRILPEVPEAAKSCIMVTRASGGSQHWYGLWSWLRLVTDGRRPSILACKLEFSIGIQLLFNASMLILLDSTVAWRGKIASYSSTSYKPTTAQ